MFYASAYPNSDISAGAMTAIAVVMTAVLVFWLAMIYVAAREPREHRQAGQQPQAGGHAAVADRGDVAEDEHKGTVLTG